jgi:SAM-dependent methyltransferase
LSNQVFDDYAAYYNLLYQDKDYAAEAAYLARHLSGSQVLSLGCGTGRHDFEMARLGFQVTGVDLSESMLATARVSQSTNQLPVEFVQSDLRHLKLARQFESVYSLFHVMSYQVSNLDLQQAFQTAWDHLAPGGVFCFDFWHGPGVLSDPPAVRIRRLENEQIAVVRLAEPKLRSSDNVVEVHYEIWVTDKANQQTRVIREQHDMRYLFVPELNWLAQQQGFEWVSCQAWMKLEPADLGDWHAFVCLRKP